MEVIITDHSFLPEACIVSVRCGATRRQAPVDVVRTNPLKFPCALEECCQPLRIEVFQPIASTRLVLRAQSSSYRVGLDAADKTEMTLGLRVQSSLCGTTCLSPTPEPSVGCKVPDAAGAARDYLENHGILKYIQGLLHAVIQVRPEDPYFFMLKQLEAVQKVTTLSTPPLQEARQPAAPTTPPGPCGGATVEGGGAVAFVPVVAPPAADSPAGYRRPGGRGLLRGASDTTAPQPGPQASVDASLVAPASPVEAPRSDAAPRARKPVTSEVEGAESSSLPPPPLEDSSPLALRHLPPVSKDEKEEIGVSEASPPTVLLPPQSQSKQDGRESEVEDSCAKMEEVISRHNEAIEALKLPLERVQTDETETRRGPDDVDALRARLRPLLETALGDGELEKALRITQSHENGVIPEVAIVDQNQNESDLQDLRMKLRAALERSADSGELAQRLDKLLGNEPKTMSENMALDTPSLQLFRMQLREVFERSAANGDLERACQLIVADPERPSPLDGAVESSSAQISKETADQVQEDIRQMKLRMRLRLGDACQSGELGTLIEATAENVRRRKATATTLATTVPASTPPPDSPESKLVAMELESARLKLCQDFATHTATGSLVGILGDALQAAKATVAESINDPEAAFLLPKKT